MPSAGDVTVLLRQWAEGDEAARDRLLPVVYDDLRRLARGYMRREKGGHTLQPTALVHEAFLRYAAQGAVPSESRGQFFALMAQTMRRVLVDHARRKDSEKRGGEVTHVELNEQLGSTGSPVADVLDLDRVLGKLEAMDPRLAKVVEMRVFGGLEVADIASALSVSPATVKRDWATARAWLHRELSR